LLQHRLSRSFSGSVLSVVDPRCSTIEPGTSIGFTPTLIHCSIVASSAYHPIKSSSRPPILFHNVRFIIKHHPDKFRPFFIPISFLINPFCRGSLGHLGLTRSCPAASRLCSHPSAKIKSLFANMTHFAFPSRAPKFINAL